MSTYLSQPFQGSKYIPDIPLDIVAQGLAHKQKDTDEFRSNMQGQLDELGKNTFYKDADLTYVNGKIKDVVDKLNTFNGQDLTDGTVQSQISSMMNGIKADPEITKRIIANKQRGKAVADMIEIKEKHPDLWNVQNYMDWKDQDDAWKNDPNKTDYSATYQPYTNTHKYDEETFKDILANPVVRQEIDWTTDGHGHKVKRGEREISEVTSARLKQAAIAGMPDNVKNQHALEYRNYIKSISPDMAASMSNSEVTLYQGLLDQANQICTNPKASKDDIDRANELSILYEKAVKIGQKRTAELLDGTRPVSDYLSFDKYLDGKYQRIADVHAFSKQGEYNEDAFYMEEMKAKHARDLAYLNHGLKLKEKEADKPLPLNTDFANGVFNGLMNNNATVNANTMADLLGLTGKQDDNGYYNLPMNNTEISLNTTPLVQTSLPDADNRKVAGLQELKNAFAIYKQQNPTITTTNTSGGQTGSSHYETVNGVTISVSGPPTGTSTGVNGPSTNVTTPTFDYFISLMKQDPSFVNKMQSNYGLNLNDPKDLRDSKNAEIVLSKAVGDNQSVKFNKGTGNLKITTTTNGGNLFRGSDGELHVSTTAYGTWEEISSALGYEPTKLQGKVGTPNLIMPTGTSSKEGKALYSMPVIVKVTGDMMAKFNRNLTNGNEYGAGELKDNRTELTNTFSNKYNALKMISQLGYQDIPTSTLQSQLTAKIQKLIPDPKQQSEYMKAVSTYMNVLNSNPSSEQKAQIYVQIDKILKTPLPK